MSLPTVSAQFYRDADESISDSTLAYDVDVRLELWQPDLSAPFEDITEWLILEGSSLVYADRAAVRHTARLRFSAQLDWNYYRIKVFVDLSNRERNQFHTAAMGVYAVESWTQTLGTDPPIYDVECVDVTALLDQPLGVTYEVPTGTSYPQAIRDAAAAAGEWNRFEPANADPPIAPRVRVSVNDDDAFVVGSRIVPVGESYTWLDVISHLCRAAGYRPPYVDRDGDIIIDAERATTEAVTLDYDDPHSVIVDGAKVTTDLRLRPNQWVIYGDLVEPSIDGPAHASTLLLTHTDLQASTGPHSFAARGNRVIRRVYALDAAAQQAELAAGYTRSQAFNRAAAKLIDSDREATQQMTARIAPTTRLWHGDVIRITNAGNGSGYWRVVEWTLTFDGQPMRLRLVRRT